jgi:hypothetical protein
MGETNWNDDDDAHYVFETLGLEHPVTAARAFLVALDDPARFASALSEMVTPESRRLWGDFSAGTKWLERLGSFGIGSVARYEDGAPDVRYIKIASGITEGRTVPNRSEVDAAAFVTMVWRPEFGSWLVHAVGDVIRPEALPRTSPGVAPSV